MDRHVKTLGMLNVMFGVIALLVSVAALVAGGGLAGISSNFNDDVSGFLASVSLVFHLGIAVPCLIGGIFVQRLAEWARVFLIVVSAVNVLNAPFGTILGIYGLWVLLVPETEPLFDHAPPVRRRGPVPAAKTAAAKKADGSEGSTSIVPSTPK